MNKSYGLTSAIGSLTNPPKIEATFKSTIQSTISLNTIRQYIEYLEDAFIINKANRYNVKDSFKKIIVVKDVVNITRDDTAVHERQSRNGTKDLSSMQNFWANHFTEKIQRLRMQIILMAKENIRKSS